VDKLKLIYFKGQPIRSLNLIWLSVFFSLFYWIMESVRDVIVFNRGSLLERLFAPDAMSLWMRLLIVMILILFGVYAQSLLQRMEKTTGEGPKPARRMGMLYSGAAFGALYWILESFRDVFVFGKGNLIQRLVHPDPLSIWMRLLAVCVMLLFSVYAQRLFEEREKAQLALKKAHDELEDLVLQRTAELSKSNELLKKEIGERQRIEDELLKVNRALKTLSQCNEVMVRAVEEGALLDNICKTIVYTGGYQLAWVGIAERNGHVKIRPVTSSFQTDYNFDLSSLIETEGEKDVNPIQDVIQTGQSRILKYDKEKAASAPWMNPIVDKGLRASITLPLGSGEKSIGALNIYTTELDAFDRGEVGLLQELADDLAFGITALRTHLERNRAESEKEKIQAQLLHSQKMEAVGILAGGVAHDFNNLLTAIQISADLAMLEIGETNPVHKTLKEIHLVASHAGDLAKQLLLFSRKHPMEYVPTNINQTVGDLQKILTRMIGEDIEILASLHPQIWNVMADRGTLEQVIMNLVVNARDAMPKGGRISIQTENVHLSEQESLKMPESRPGRFVRLAVTDTGGGMTAVTLSHVFEPFFSTKGPGKGTGLGLSVVYGIIKQHEGWITVSSEPEKGTRFDICLPAVSESAVSARAKPQVRTDVRGKGERILVVEDEVSVKDYTKKALVKTGYKVTAASTAEEALRLYEKEGGRFDVIFADLVLPDKSGIELAELLHAKNSKLRILLSSGYTDKQSQWPAIFEKGFRYIQKPYALNDLLKTLREVLEK
jgi:signal transduction histidine kinase/CheY-like chemotaxis protein